MDMTKTQKIALAIANKLNYAGSNVVRSELLAAVRAMDVASTYEHEDILLAIMEGDATDA